MLRYAVVYIVSAKPALSARLAQKGPVLPAELSASTAWVAQEGDERISDSVRLKRFKLVLMAHWLSELDDFAVVLDEEEPSIDLFDRYWDIVRVEADNVHELLGAKAKACLSQIKAHGDPEAEALLAALQQP